MRITNNNYFCILLIRKDFIICLLSYLINKFILAKRLVWLRWYFNDLICGYIFTLLMDKLYERIFNKKTKIKPLLELLVIASFYWEFIFPYIHKKSTSDVIDIYMYFIGFIIYIILNRRELL